MFGSQVERRVQLKTFTCSNELAISVEVFNAVVFVCVMNMYLFQQLAATPTCNVKWSHN